jgi:hypothetical protein
MTEPLMFPGESFPITPSLQHSATPRPQDLGRSRNRLKLDLISTNLDHCGGRILGKPILRLPIPEEPFGALRE